MNIPSLAKTVILCALSLSIGWGIRGNFGHEYGAMIPGALAALAAVALSGRLDWWRRAPYFAMFGALGWSFGGSISYMWVIGYTHSGHLPSQIYGYACLFVIGFLWGALGGAGTVLPAGLDRKQLTSLFPPMLAVFAAWWLQDLIVPRIEPVASSLRHHGWLYWYDSDWIAALLAIGAVLVLAALRRRFEWGSAFILHLAIGWWAGFLLMVFMTDGLGIEFRMTPPRGDNWAGILGMTGGLFVFCLRERLRPVAHAALVAGTWGGVGFAVATFFKLIEVKYAPPLLTLLFGSGTWQTNWHSVLEQTYGLINGVGIGVVMFHLAGCLPETTDEPRTGRWTHGLAVAFVLLLIPYVNLVKIVPTLIKFQALPPQLYGWSSLTWFNLAAGALALAVIVLIIRHYSRPLALVPENSLGQTELLYLTFLWCMVLGNLARAIPPFAEQRLITEGVIHFNAVACTICMLRWAPPALTQRLDKPTSPALPRNLFIGLAVFIITVTICAWGTREMWGNTWVKEAGYHTRFGPDAKHGKPPPDEPHP
jgi:hypothetical protein